MFEDLQQRYRALTELRREGRLDPQAFREAAMQLRALDPRGRWWQIEPDSGAWLVWTGTEWQPGDPDSSPVECISDADQDLARTASETKDERALLTSLRHRSQRWWDALSVAGGAAAGYLWFTYSSVRGFGSPIPSLVLALLPLGLMLLLPQRVRRGVSGLLSELGRRGMERIPAERRSATLRILRIGWPLLAIALLLLWLFGDDNPTGAEQPDWTTPLLMVGIPVVLALFRAPIDGLLQPIQPWRRRLTPLTRVGTSLALPMGLGFVLAAIGLQEYGLAHWNMALGTLGSYAVLHDPAQGGPGAGQGKGAPPGTGKAAGGLPAKTALLFVIGLTLPLLWSHGARADDCLSDPFNLKDCLRTIGTAPILSGLASTVVSVLVNGGDLVQVLLPPQEQSPPAATPSAPTEVESDEKRRLEDDLKRIREYQSFLQANKAGQAPAGFNTSEIDQRLKDLQQQERELIEKIRNAGGDTNYQAAARAPITVNPDFIEANRRSADDLQRNRLAEVVQRIQQVSLKTDLPTVGPGSVSDAAQRLLKDLREGKPINPQSIEAMHKLVADRILGKTMSESAAAASRTSFSDSLNQAMDATAREAVTGVTSEGRLSLGGMLIRGLAFGATGGLSEAGFIAGNVGYVTKDACDRGLSDSDIIAAAGTTAAVQTAMTLVPMGAMRYGGQMFPGISAGIGNMIGAAGRGASSAATALEGAIQGTRLGGVVDAVSAGMRTVGQRISQTLPVPAAASAPVSAELSATRTALQNVLSRPTSSAGEIASIYSQGGMDQLARLQAAGQLSKAEARMLNAKLSEVVNRQINKSVTNSINTFERDALELTQGVPVRVEKTILADSGSSARLGGNPKAQTDFDLTHITRLNPADVERAAVAMEKTPAEAERVLQDLFQKNLTRQVDASLKEAGFAGGAKDVQFKAYSGIGGRSGPVDAYPQGYTEARQMTGKATEYNVIRTETGTVEAQGRSVSGKWAVDQHSLNTTGSLPSDPGRFTASEFKDFSQQQVKALNPGIGDPPLTAKTAAKAMGREMDLMQRINNLSNSPLQAHRDSLVQAGINPRPAMGSQSSYVDIASQISKNPDQAGRILASAGMTEQQFIQGVRDVVETAHQNLSIP